MSEVQPALQPTGIFSITNQATDIVASQPAVIVGMQHVAINVDNKDHLCLLVVTEDGLLKMFALGERQSEVVTERVLSDEFNCLHLNHNETIKW